MTTLLRRAAAVAAFGIVALLGFRALRTRGSARYAEARARATEACRSFRVQPHHEDADVCRYDEFGPLTFERFHAAESDLDEAREAFARHEPARAGRVLLRVSASAREMERQGVTRFASTTVDQLVVLLHEHGAELDDWTRRDILENARLEAPKHPFERERLTHLWALAHYEKDRLDDAPRLSPGELADEMARDEAAYRAMEQAVRSSDVNACEASARGLGRLGHADHEAKMCALLVQSVRTRQRIDGM